MRKPSESLLLFAILAAMPLLPFPADAIASPPAADARSDNSRPPAWMPDVAARVAALRARSEHANDDARVRRGEDPRGGQWWRLVAAAPPQKLVR